MKTKLLLLILLLLTTATTVFASAGNELGNGGDLVAQEFIAAGRKLAEELRRKPDPRIPDAEKFAAAVEAVKVSTAESLTLHGNEVDAINFPQDQHIDVSRSRWRESTPGKRASLVLHEYLGVMGVDDGHYQISGSYAEAFAIPEEKPKRFEATLFSNYGMAQTLGQLATRTMWSERPGFGLFAGYHLTNRSTLGIQVDSQKFARNYDEDYRFGYTTLELAVTYKYWLASAAPLRPYFRAGLGYGKLKHESAFRTSSYTTEIWDSDFSDNAFAGQLGLGIRYALMKEVGLDLSGHVHALYGKPGNAWKTMLGYAFGQLGVDVMF